MMGFVDGGLGAIAGGILGFGGSLVQSSSAQNAASDANAFTKEQLQKRHQWEVADLKKAGLNPILSAGGTPSIGGSAAAQVPNIGEAISQGVSSGAQAARLQSEIDKVKADTDASKEAVVTQKTQQEANEAQAASARALARLYDQNAQGAAYDNSMKKIDSEIYSGPLGKTIRAFEKGASIFRDTGVGIGSAAGGVGSGMANSAKAAETRAGIDQGGKPTTKPLRVTVRPKFKKDK